MKVRSIPGVFDVIPGGGKDLWRNSALWQMVEQKIRHLCSSYCFEEVRTPLLERTELFVKSTGSSSDIVTKEMYAFEDRGGRQVTLRPEGTPPVLRAFLENGLVSQGGVSKLFYLAPMFRYERPQAGRYRQHHQFGVEVLGSPAPEQDAEVITLLMQLVQSLELSDAQVRLNSLGTAEARNNYRAALVSFLTPKAAALSEESQKRLVSNPLRILDSKAPEDQAALEGAPALQEFLSDSSLTHLQRVEEALQLWEIPYQLDPQLVRGLDYYTETVFEVVSGSLGAQNSLGGGGRYDGLVKSLGGPDLPGVGFGCGLERLLQVLVAQHPDSLPSSAPLLTLIPLGKAGMKQALSLAQALRQDGYAIQVDYSQRKLNKAFQQANKTGSRYCAVIGDGEIASGTVQLKQMQSGEEQTLPFAQIGAVIHG